MIKKRQGESFAVFLIVAIGIRHMEDVIRELCIREELRKKIPFD